MAFTPTKNLDVLVASHEIARERLKAGKPAWDCEFRIKQFFSKEEDDAAVKRIGKQVAAEIRRTAPASWLDIRSDDYERDLDECVEHFEDILSSDDVGSSQDDFNCTLEAAPKILRIFDHP
jgi:hypothetical protein